MVGGKMAVGGEGGMMAGVEDGRTLAGGERTKVGVWGGWRMVGERAVGGMMVAVRAVVGRIPRCT